MLYLLALILPPVAVLCCGRPGAALLNFVLTILFYFPGAIHAVLVVNSHYADERNQRLIDAQARQNGRMMDAFRQMQRRR